MFLSDTLLDFVAKTSTVMCRSSCDNSYLKDVLHLELHSSAGQSIHPSQLAQRLGQHTHTHTHTHRKRRSEQTAAFDPQGVTCLQT